MATGAFLYIFTLLVIVKSSLSSFRGVQGDYCAIRRPQECCPGRDDLCTVPLMGTLCYCDRFCDRTTSDDCCPDFWSTCAGIPKPTPTPRCFRNGSVYALGGSFMENCHLCTCRADNFGNVRIFCENDKPCLIRPDLIEVINHGNHGWTASNYSFLWGKTLEEGISQRLGTFRPTKKTLDMGEMHVSDFKELPEKFDARLKWSTWIQPIRDQGDCGASWAFSSTALVSDRLAVMSGGLLRVELSPQMLISCQGRGARGCSGGHTDRALLYIRKHGVSREKCYPYYSGYTSKARQCEIKRIKPKDRKDHPKIRCIHNDFEFVYYSTPPYRISRRESVIMQEIIKNGPVQAVFQVKEDFYAYKSGIYYHTRSSEHLPESYRRIGWHSVRIIGWGVDHSRRLPVKYWLCANSWGSQWGEAGYFRILRGTNECDIESFIVGVWANREDPNTKYIIDYGRIRPSG